MDDIFRVPFDLVAEESFVGEILASKGTLLTELADVQGDLCHHWILRFILDTCLAMHAERLPIDLSTVTQRILASGQAWTGMHGSWPGELTRLHNGAAGTVATASYFLDTLREQRSLRRQHENALWAAKATLTSKANPTVILAETNQRLASCEVLAASEENILPGLLDSLMEELDRLDEGKAPRILQTCIPAWNKAFGGLPESSYIGLGARPGLGKTSMIEQIIFDLLEREIPCSVFMKDMSPKKFLARLATRAAQVPFWKLAKGYTTPQERVIIRGMYQVLRESHLHLHNPRGLTAAKMCAIIRQDKQRYDTQAAFLDHIQVLDLDGAELTAGLTKASITIRANATETGVPHVVLFHLNRNGAGTKRPTAEDVKQFDQLYGDVDSMALLWSEQKMEDWPDGKRFPMHFYYPKDRDGGAGEDEIWFEGPFLTFHATEFPETAKSTPPKFPYDPWTS